MWIQVCQQYSFFPSMKSLLDAVKNFLVTEAQHSRTVTSSAPSDRSDSVVPDSAEQYQQEASVKPPALKRFKFLSS